MFLHNRYIVVVRVTNTTYAFMSLMSLLVRAGNASCDAYSFSTTAVVII